MGEAVYSLPDGQLREALLDVWAQEQALAARRLQLIREVDGRDLARRDGYTSAAMWISALLRINPGVARQMVTLAQLLDASCSATAEALAAGQVNEAQARVIAAQVGKLASHGPQVQADAEQALLSPACTVLEPTSLSAAASRVLEWVAPEIAEAAQRRALENAERQASRDRYLTLTRLDGEGRTRLSGVLGVEAAAIITAAIEPLCKPAGPHDDRNAGQRRADALTDVCRLALATEKLPANGGTKPHVVVTTDWDHLHHDLSEGMLDTGATLSAEAVRRLACDAGIIPAVLNADGLPLDVGREQRLFGVAIRRALVLRDGGCSFPGCDRPPKWCQCHHIKHWCKGGTTCLSNAVLACGFHHDLLHHGGWEVRIAADGIPEFLPPAHLDPTRTPRRNHFWRRP